MLSSAKKIEKYMGGTSVPFTTLRYRDVKLTSLIVI